MNVINDKNRFQAINWNKVEDPMDKMIWEKLTSQFWLDTRFPLSNDLTTWDTLTEEEKTLTMRVFTGLTLLDTIQGQVGAPALMADAVTPHEEAVLTNIAFMESVHAKSYSSVFSTLSNTKDIDAAFRWSEENEFLQLKARIVDEYYRPDWGGPQWDQMAVLKKKAASTLLESFLFYSGFYLPLWWSTQAKLTNTANMIKFIIKDEAVHGYYIGYKFQQQFNAAPDFMREEIEDWVFSLLQNLYENEVNYTRDVYPADMVDDVLRFLRYNANKALMNLGFEPLFSAEATEVNPKILAALSISTATGDFFSGTNSYLIGKREDTTDDDWSLVLDAA